MTSAKDQLSKNWPTIFELAATVPQINLVTSRGGKNRPPITQGLVPEPFPAETGYFEATPEQLASLKVPKIEVTDEVRGFQREKKNAHVRNIARAMLDGKEMPPLMISIFEDGQAYVDDGQHRALASIFTRIPLEVVVKRRTVEQARQLFASQSKGAKLRRDETLLTGDSPLELYIQDALTSTNHPWSSLVGMGASRYRMSPTSMASSVGSYVYNSLSTSISEFVRRPDDFDETRAASMADFLHAFGTKATNPVAFRGTSIRAITFAAIYIFRRNENVAINDVGRWMTHMPMFDFYKYPHLMGKEGQLAIEMVNHWNKRLPMARRVNPHAHSVV
jgi:hypothetical protein